MVQVAVNGNCLLPNPNDCMDEDFVAKDVMIYTVSAVRKCSEFRREALRGRSHLEDSKQRVADRVMASLRRLHDRTEQARMRLLAEQGLGTGGDTSLPENRSLH
jgi:hypothetical protein